MQGLLQVPEGRMRAQRVKGELHTLQQPPQFDVDAALFPAQGKFLKNDVKGVFGTRVQGTALNLPLVVLVMDGDTNEDAFITL